MKPFFWAVVAAFFLCSSFAQRLRAGKGDKQGIAGYVRQVTGNQMPSPDEPLPAPKGVKTTVYVYEKTNLSQVDRTGTEPFYTAVRTKLIRTVQSTSKGYFFVSLPVGSYSLFTKAGGKFYANSFDGENNIAVVTVGKNKVADANIKISAGATY